MKLITSVLFLAVAANACAWDADSKKWLCSWTEPAPEGVLRCGPNLTPLRSSNGAPYCGQPESCKPEKPRNALWKASLAVAGAGVAMDVASSWRRPELNSLYRAADGTFGERGIALRVGMAASMVGIQWLVMRTHPPAWVGRAFAAVNFASGTRSMLVAKQNWEIAR